MERLQVLAMELDIGANHRNNRFSRRRLGETFWTAAHAGVPIRDAKILEIGAGSVNPLGAAFLFVVAGARRAVAVDPELPQDPVVATRALAYIAAWALADPRLVLDDFPITREQVASNIEDFDIGKLLYADSSGIPDGRLELLHESAGDLPLDDAQFDISVSISTLEHLEDPDASIAELARVTRPGGVGCHTIDGVDHRHYGDPSIDPLEFLELESNSPLVAECNRIRPLHFCDLFESNGFEVLELDPHSTIEVTEERRASFAEPYRSMPINDLQVTRLGIKVRRH